MAKKRKGRPPGSANRPRLETAAKSVGSTLGAVMAKVDAWMAQREEIAKELRSAADRIMTGENPFPWRQGGTIKVRSGDGAISSGRKSRKRPKMSKEARAKIAAAQRARWANQKAAQSPTAAATAPIANKAKRARKP